MNREQVDHTLEGYNRSKARAAYLEGQLAAARRDLARAREDSIADRVRLTASLTAMPRGGTPGDPVGNLAARDADGEESLRTVEARRELDQRRRALDDARFAVAAVDAWLLALSPREAYLVTHRRIHGESWRQIMPAYDAAFGDEYSKDNLRRILTRAMDKIYEVAQAV